ncbi:MAG: hypothetical protein A3A80_02805 [Candidatus Terrybacteria bacterium RIFCSPLOWO2_01_FULL_44_24]|uniref:Uncharacterized protein n=1 Tax=Candidatus Terrybacteria bacterium RIFCSPHIGHO2_01_FULL_43_35 TaxID=1802361 RepID=A0A1G2PGL9_9BACT|nr:MAG: hypothetical protein A2828_02595 [Candidatus Terrybacteria bacterium RIFCSPHIGHO2_01_FULL_43_35]OHA50999.1 MAG: hypothetical protein A3A80_02805 [Candidatus Terrybacteria bacterium RIFCSPLOWO2_01_FULL_44_24]
MDKIKELRKLRRKGHSINELVSLCVIPKTTVWYHIHNIKLLPKYEKTLKAKIGGNTQRKQKRLEVARKNAAQLLRGSDRDLSIAIAMLYWGEGNKKVANLLTQMAV